MSPTTPMTPLRRRPMPGMPSAPSAPPQTSPSHELDSVEGGGATPAAPAAPAPKLRPRSAKAPSGAAGQKAQRRHPVEDYATTHLTNFRLPVDLHVRYGRLIAEAQEQHPRLRKMSLTEVVIALLAEGPQTADEVAELVRRKRADEHGQETQR